MPIGQKEGKWHHYSLNKKVIREADIFESYSAGTETKPQINQDAVRIMKEIYGIDMSKGEFNSVAQANGGLENMINWEGKDKDLLALIKYIAEEDKLEKVLENPQVIKTPVVRNGKQSTLGYQPDIWKVWK